MTEPQKPQSKKLDAITIKKYANRRLYNTATSTYVTLDDLCDMIKQGQEFNVYDAKTGEELTRSVLTQIIVEQEGKGDNLLPISFMRQLIKFYGGGADWLVPKYLEHSFSEFTRNQEQMRQTLQANLGGMFPFNMPMQALEQAGKQNMALIEQAMKMFSPFAAFSTDATQNMQTQMTNNLQELQQKMAAMQQGLAPKTGDKK